MKFNFNQSMLLFTAMLVIQEAIADSNLPSHTKVDAASNQQSSLRIIGGQDTREGMWPWMVYIGYTIPEGDSASCGGSLIHPYWVLTAAHCIDGFNFDEPPLTKDELFVVVGLHQRNRVHEQGERFAIERVIQHPRWNPYHPSLPFDIALLQLKKPATQQLVTLPLEENEEIKPDTLATALGWGLIEPKEEGAFPEVLQQLELPIVSNKTCQTTYQTEYEIIDSMICAGFKAGKKDTCKNDSGGPLVIFKENQWQQVGIVSFGGHNTQGAPICAGPDAYGVYTRVSAFIDFIAKYVPLSMTGAYDGVWTSPALPNTFVILRNTTETLAMVFFSENGKNWQALLGSLSYPTITMKNFIAPATITLELKPTLVASPPIREINLTTMMCRSTSENAACLLSEGDTIKLNKIF